jgi:hypothetical protein
MARQLWVAVLVLLGDGLARADDPVPINIKDRGKGETVQVEQTDTTVFGSKLVDHDGKTVQEQMVKVVFTYVYRETYLARQQNKPATRIRREYEKAQATCDGVTDDLPFHGKTVIIEQKDGKYYFSLEDGKDVTEEKDVDFTLGKEFNSPNLERRYRLAKEVLPGKPASLNESWAIDVKSIIAARAESGTNYDEDKAAGTGTLSKVYSKDGKKFGTLHLHITAPVKSFGYWPTTIAAQDGSKREVEEDVDICIDGQEETGVYKTRRSSTLILNGDKGGVGITQTSNVGPLTIQKSVDAKKGQVSQVFVVDSVKSVRELPKK